ncbi:hypothetical protein AB0M48_12140 [Lentzea sp. NPDC051208]|uniref:hypothetical protein n=1 Tax=Lentzea sp. NPDC051208 TaxID=3154642 RepID=UPI00342D885D
MTDSRDFESWDWKQIRAAVVGHAATPRESRPTSVPHADPNSIRHAAQVFNRARETLQFVSDNLRLQVEALAGENGAWKSPASEVFRSINLHLAANLEAKADQINGGEVMGLRSVPAQLWNAGNYLEWAQNTIKWIDGEYARYVRSQGGVRMPNALTKMSDYPEIVAQMTEDMKKVVRILASEYEISTASVVVPSAVDFQPKPGGPDLGDLPSGDNKPPPNLDIGPPPNVNNADGAGTGGDDPPPNLDISPPPSTDANGGSGGGTGADTGLRPPPSLNVEPPPGLDLSGGDGADTGLRPPPSLNLDPPPGAGGDTGGGRSGLGLPPSLNIPPPPVTDGGTRGGGGTGAGTGSGTGGGTALPKPPPLSITPPAGGGSGLGGDSVGRPPQLDIEAPPGAGVDSGLGGDSAGRPPQLDIEAPPGAGVGNDRGGMNMPPAAPMMPPAGGAPTGGNADRPDSSGLLGGLTEPWAAGSPPAIDPSGTEPPAAKPEDWAASPSTGTGGGLGGGLGSQVPPPMMPPPMAGGQPPGATGERPDSSGLLGGEKEPWEGPGLPVADLDAASPPPSIKPEEWAAATGDSAGIGAGVPVVGGPTATEPPVMEETPEAAEPVAQQLLGGGAGAGLGSQVPPPMMPPPMAGGQPPGATGERPDSSGLLGGFTEPWAGAPNAGGVGGASGATSASAERWAVPPAEPVDTPADSSVEPLPVVEEVAPVVTPVEEAAPVVTPVISPVESLPVVEEVAPVVTPVEEVVALAQTPAEAAVPEPGTAVPAQPAEKIAPTPAAAPAGWAASSGLVAGGQEGSHAVAALFGAAGAATTAAAFGAVTGQVPGAPPSGPTPPSAAPASGSTSLGVGGLAGSTQAHLSEFPHVDQEGAVQDGHDEDEGGGLVLQGGSGGPLPGVDSVAVVRLDDAVKDVTAWDSGGAGFLLAGAPLAAVAAKSDRSGWEIEQPTTGVTPTSSQPWEPEPSVTHATYRRRKHGEAPVIVDDEDDEVWCGDEYSFPEEEREAFLAREAERRELLRREEAGEDGEEEEPEERSAADLLSKSSAAWGSTAASPSGVLE